MKPNIDAEEIAENLVRACLFEEKLDLSQREAFVHLQTAAAGNSNELPLWLTTCARLGVTEAAALTERLLNFPSSDEVLFAAMDAARAVVRPDTEAAQRVAGRLIALADEVLVKGPFNASRALLGAVMLDLVQGGGQHLRPTAKMAAAAP